jgi:hypothetical protein
MKNQESLVAMLALIGAIACAPSAPAQTFKRVKVKGGAALVQVASGGASVWALASNGNPYVLKGKQFILANTVSLVSIAIGGGSLLQADEVWGLDSPGNIYRATRSGTSWTFSQVPGVLSRIAVGPGTSDHCHPYEVWGVNTSTQIFRYNFCGKNFEQVPGILKYVYVGGAGVWGVNPDSRNFRFNFATGVFDLVKGVVVEMAIGPNNVWGLVFLDQVYEFLDNVQRFSQMTGSFVEIRGGGEGIWALDSPGDIFRLEPSTSTFVQIPGLLDDISVGSGAGVWGISAAHEAYAFSTP